MNSVRPAGCQRRTAALPSPPTVRSAVISIDRWLPFVAFACLAVVWASGADSLPGSIVPTVNGAADQSLTFERDVRPLLKAHCFQCHGEEPELSGGLDVRLVRLLATGGESGSAVVSGNAAESLLWQRISSDEMPPGAKKMSAAEKATIERWIGAGAKTARPEPEHPDQAKFTDEELSHWAFQAVKASPPPANPLASSAATASIGPVPTASAAIDAFIAAKLTEAGLTLSPLADRRTLIRRLTFDLHGLPPTPEEVDAFVSDLAPNAYEKLVDRLLASPQYGVRWGRHWLDVAGYAESDGNLGRDQARPHAWRYRDYVIDSLNQDKPYDRFLVEQLAGDELIEGTPDPNNLEHVNLLAATGLLRMAPDITETDDTLMDRNQAVADTLQVVSTVALGITVGCAQCHDHRYDPITIEDYYRLRAVFDPALPIHQWKKPGQRLVDMTDDATRAATAVIEAEAVALQEDINARRRTHCQAIQDREIQNAPEEVREALRAAVNLKPADQSDEQKALLDRYPKVRTIDWIVGQLIEYDMPAYRRFEEEEKQVAAIRKKKPISRLIMTVAETPDQPQASHVFFRGSPESPADEVTPGELTVLVAARPHVHLPVRDESKTRTTGRRLAYARQLTDGTHPLVARVAVNRIWMHHFGRGLVASAADFGLAGEAPSHPELLDWLADDFVRGGWSMKRLHKQIVMAAVYQQTAQRRSDQAATLALGIDPENRLLSRMNLRRLEAEAVRDAILAVSGQLIDQVGGPSVPVAEDGEGKAVIGTRLLRDGLFAGVEDAGDQAFRRSVYISATRALPLNVLQTFDLPAMTPNCNRRDSSTVTPQALWFMNDESVVAASQRMAESLKSQSQDPTEQIRLAYRRAFAAEPTAEEITECSAFLDSQVATFRAAATADPPAGANPAAGAELQALASLCQMLLSSNRFLYVP